MDRIYLGFTDNNPVSRLALFDKVGLDNEQNKPDNNAYVTKFTAYHLTGRYQNEYVLDILYQIETTDSTSDFEQLTDQMKELLRKIQNELRDKRDRLYVVYNKDTADVYCTLADNMKIQDRDSYIKDLVNYYEIIKELKDIYKEKNVETDSLKEDSDQSFYDMQDEAMRFLDGALSVNSARICDSSSLYGDLSAVHNLMWGISSKVPDLTFNCGVIQVD